MHYCTHSYVDKTTQKRSRFLEFSETAMQFVRQKSLERPNAFRMVARAKIPRISRDQFRARIILFADIRDVNLIARNTSERHTSDARVGQFKLERIELKDVERGIRTTTKLARKNAAPGLRLRIELSAMSFV